MIESDRLHNLNEYHIVDTPREKHYDDLSQLAAYICGTPIAVISLIDAHRQWFKSAFGLSICETDRSISFCSHVVAAKAPLIVENALEDSRFNSNPAVTGDAHIRFYAGIPLISPEGFALGALAVVDIEPRQLSAQQIEALTTLAYQVMTNLNYRRQGIFAERTAYQRVKNIISSAATGIVVVALNGEYLVANPYYCEIFGYTEVEMTAIGLGALIHSEDLRAVSQKLRAILLSETRSFTFENRCIKKNGDVIWVKASISVLHDDQNQSIALVGVVEDITEKKNAEHHAAKLLERFQTTLESITDGFYTLDNDWNFSYVNAEAERLLEKNREQLLGKNIWETFPDAVGGVIEQSYREATLTKNKIFIETYFLPLKSWFRINAYPSAEGISVYFQSVNEQRIAEEQLKLLETCVAHMNDLIIITEAAPIDEPGPRILFVNDAFIDRTGYAREDVIGRSPRFLQGPKTQHEQLEKIRQSMEQGKPVRAELINYTKSGHELWLELDLFPITDKEGRLIHWVSVERDVSDRKKIEQQLYESEQRFKLIAKATADTIWDWNLTTGELWWSEGMQTFFGYSLNDLEKDGTSWTNRIHPDDIERIVVSINSVIEGDTNNWVDEYRFIRSNGTYAYVIDRGFVIRSDEGKAIRMVGGITDLSTAKDTEAELKKIDEIKHAQQVAELASQAKSNFLATMSHEIRTPISGVIGMVDVLHQTSLKEYQVEMVDIIRDSAFSLLGIIDEILDFSKIESGKLEIESVPFSLHRNIAKVCSLLDKLALDKGVELSLFTDPAMPDYVLGDDLRVRQVLINLINNAIKFSADLDYPGRVKLHTSAQYTEDQQWVVEFKIIDNGIGMSPKTLDNLFTPFMQADASTSRRFGGTGLGLTITEHLVSLMNGQIQVESALHSGSIFSVRIPFTIPAESSPSQEFSLDLRHVNCIVVGDDASLASVWASYLAACGAAIIRREHLAHMDIAPATHSINHTWLWVLDNFDTTFSLNNLASVIPPRLKSREIHCLMIGRGQRRQVRVDAGGVAYIDANALDASRFLKAVAIALGSIDLDKDPVTEKKAAQLPVPTREEAILNQQLILLAEDNTTNQQVILRQLALLGFNADTVTNGVEALARLESGCYSLLITDLHMPKMDGYKLIETIRQHSKHFKKIPIITLSANALRGEAEKCKLLGANDYLIKPALLNELKATIDLLLPSNPAYKPVNISKRSQIELGMAPDPHFDVNVLKELIGNDTDILKEFLSDYQHSALQMGKHINEAYARADYRNVAAHTHTLKSSSRSVGALFLGDICERLEHLCNQRAAIGIAESLDGFNNELKNVDLLITAFIRAVEGGASH